ncbi:MAG: hypothetical protein ACRDL8_09315, partial [Solirubrobacteraceae bacterium]
MTAPAAGVPGIGVPGIGVPGIGVPAGGAEVRATRSVRPGRYGMAGLLRSEWTKLRTVRSTMWTLGMTVLLGIGVSVIATAETRAHWSTMSPGSQAGFDPASTSLVGILISQLVIGILGVLVMSSE